MFQKLICSFRQTSRCLALGAELAPESPNACYSAAPAPVAAILTGYPPGPQSSCKCLLSCSNLSAAPCNLLLLCRGGSSTSAIFKLPHRAVVHACVCMALQCDQCRLQPLAL